MKYAIFIFLSLFYLKSHSSQLLVPQNYSTIQNAIDSANIGDTIIVDNGLYYENLLISGKDVLLTSNFLFTGNFDDIHNTIIDGSNSSFTDTASVIRILNGCSSQMKVLGFTIQGGRGTPFDLGGIIYTEGGGIFIEFSSPEISFNYVTNNDCRTKAGSSFSAGGGAIHTFFDSANIHNNILEGNYGLYGNGIVLNNSNGIFQNNLVYNNRGASEFGAGGVMVFCTVNSSSCKIFNNTIVSNLAISGFGTFAARGGGLFNIDCDNTILENNIIWGNYQKFGDEIANSNGQFFQTSYNTTGGTLGGINYNFNPDFRDSSFLAISGSASLDSGNPDSLHNDIENQSNPGNALFPSQSTVRNDLGIYGGPIAALLPIIEKPFYNQSRNQFSYTNPSSNDTITSNFSIRNLGSTPLIIDSLEFLSSGAVIHFDTLTNLLIKPMSSEVISLKWTPVSLVNNTLFIYHNDNSLGNVSTIFFNINLSDLMALDKFKNIKIFPNPIADFVTIKILSSESFELKIRDIYGRVLEFYKISETTKIDLRHFNSGVYFFQLNDKQNTTIKAVIK